MPEKSGRPIMVIAMPGEVGDKGVGKVPRKKTCQVSSKPRWPTACCPLSVTGSCSPSDYKTPVGWGIR